MQWREMLRYSIKSARDLIVSCKSIIIIILSTETMDVNFIQGSKGLLCNDVVED